MLPRWLTALGFLGLCTSFACFPPTSIGPIAQVERRTGASPWPSGYVPPSPSAPPGSPTPSPSPEAAAAAAARAYFPLRVGTWRYRIATSPAGGAPIAGDRTLAIADVVASGDATTATTVSTATLNVPGFTALDEAEVRGQAALTPDRFSLSMAGRTTAIPLGAVAGTAWSENGLTARIASWGDALTIEGRALEKVLRVEYADPAAPATPVATLWFASGIGLVQRVDAFTHDGKAWEARAELIAHPAE